METFQERQEGENGPARETLSRSIAEQQWPWRGDYVMAVFEVGVCADESGIHEGAALCILSGYIASIKQWLWFDDRWFSVLERNDVADFHSKSFFAFDEFGKRAGRYRRWSNPEEKASYGDWTDDKANVFLRDLLMQPLASVSMVSAPSGAPAAGVHLKIAEILFAPLGCRDYKRPTSIRTVGTAISIGRLIRDRGMWP